MICFSYLLCCVYFPLFLHIYFTCQLFFSPFFLFFSHTSCTLFPTNKPLHPQCRRRIILEYEGALYRIEVEALYPLTPTECATLEYTRQFEGYRCTTVTPSRLSTQWPPASWHCVSTGVNTRGDTRAILSAAALYASWFHEECVGIQCDADRGGVWPCPECRQNGTRMKTLTGMIEGLVSDIRVIGEQLASSEKERRDERIRTEERAMALHKEVVTLKEQVVTLTWRTFRQPSQPSSLLIGSSFVRNASQDKLVDTDVICLPGGKLADVKRKLEQQPSGFDTITVLAGGTTATRRHHPLPRLLLRPTAR